eukprot:TRINITY_DN3118_c0_g1_i2.p2 TRINITY_DN3118_c0_g1~~TRINITY_DN3118_c0_g1_i2.p2  ORF type:complete len:141 (-),score=36.73 TRINITY_DN3118_c0_g1_i2:65-487(-)
MFARLARLSSAPLRASSSTAFRAAPRTRMFSAIDGPRPDEIVDGPLSAFDHATGREKMEMIAEMEGRKPYGDDYLGGPFGTREKPVLVPSVFDNRIVGCVGGDGDNAHDLLWHEVTTEKPTMCAECGQVFALKQIENHHH